MTYDLRYGDCFKLLNDIPDNSVDLILTDPPYNIAKYSTGNIVINIKNIDNNVRVIRFISIPPYIFQQHLLLS